MGLLDQEIDFMGVDDPRWWTGNDADDNGRVSPVDPPVRESAPVESKQPKAPPKPKIVSVKPDEKPAESPASGEESTTDDSESESESESESDQADKAGA